MLKWAYPPLSIFNQSKFPSFELLGVGGKKENKQKLPLSNDLLRTRGSYQNKYSKKVAGQLLLFQLISFLYLQYLCSQ